MIASLLLIISVILMGYGFFHIGYSLAKRKYEKKPPPIPKPESENTK